MSYRMLGVAVPLRELESYAHETLADWKGPGWDEPAIVKMADMFLEAGYPPDTVVGQYYSDEMDMPGLGDILDASGSRGEEVVIGERGSGFEDVLAFDPDLRVVHHFASGINVVWIPVVKDENQS